MSTAERHRRPRSAPASSRGATGPIPRLESGDRLSADEYMRRYEAMPGTRAELVEGVVYVSSPVSMPHGDSHIDLSIWAGTYRVYTPGVGAGADATVLLDPDNTPQPDVHVRILPESGGRIRVSEGERKFIVGAPEMTIEVAASSVSYDLHDKMESYRRNEVWEYLVWRVEDEQIDWFALRDGQYARIEPDADGLLKSAFFPGLWLDADAALGGDMPRVLQALNLGLASPEHAAFVARLAEARARIAPGAGGPG